VSNKKIANFILQDMLFRDIADITFIAEKTVEKHTSNIYTKVKGVTKNSVIEKYSNNL